MPLLELKHENRKLRKPLNAILRKVEMLRGGSPWMDIQDFQSFKVSKILSSNIPDFFYIPRVQKSPTYLKFSKSQRFRKQIHFMRLLKILIPCYQNSISCFLEDIDPIFKISKNTLDGSPGLFGPHRFQHVQYFRFPELWNFKKIF